MNDPPEGPDQWEWPCEKREAHDPHVREWIEEWSFADPEPTLVPGASCPGVMTHPATMAGRNDVPRKAAT